MGIVLDAIADLTAQVTREIDAPRGDLGYGTDLSCTDDLTPDMAEVLGDSPRAVAEANYRRLRTPRGTVRDDQLYGIDLAGFLHQGMTQSRIVELEGIIRSELQKDDRNDTVTVRVTAPNVRQLDIAIRGTIANGSYSLTLALVDGELLLKEIQANGNA